MSNVNLVVKVHTKPCIVCGKRSIVYLPKDKYDRWQSGTLIQKVFPEMSVAGRELLISGTHERCWDELWSSVHDDDE